MRGTSKPTFASKFTHRSPSQSPTRGSPLASRKLLPLKRVPSPKRGGVQFTAGTKLHDGRTNLLAKSQPVAISTTAGSGLKKCPSSFPDIQYRNNYLLPSKSSFFYYLRRTCSFACITGLRQKVSLTQPMKTFSSTGMFLKWIFHCPEGRKTTLVSRSARVVCGTTPMTSRRPRRLRLRRSCWSTASSSTREVSLVLRRVLLVLFEFVVCVWVTGSLKWFTFATIYLIISLCFNALTPLSSGRSPTRLSVVSINDDCDVIGSNVLSSSPPNNRLHPLKNPSTPRISYPAADTPQHHVTSESSVRRSRDANNESNRCSHTAGLSCEALL